MILDKENVFSAAQEVTSTAASTYGVDLGNKSSLIQSIVEYGRVDLLVTVNTSFTAAKTVAIAVQVDDDSSFGSATTLATVSVSTTLMVAGYHIPISVPIAYADEQYMRLYYTVTGTVSAGKLDAAIILDRQTNGI